MGQPTAQRRSLGRTGALVLTVNGGLVAVGFATSVLVSRTLGPSGKGSFDLMTSTTALLSLLLGASLAAGVTFGVARRAAVARQLLLPLVAVAVAQALIAMLVLTWANGTALGATLLPPGGGQRAVMAITFAVGLSGLAVYGRGILAGLDRVLEANLRDALGRAALLAALFAGTLVAAGNGAPPTSTDLIVAWAAGWLIAAVIVVVGLPRPALRRPDASTLRGLAAFGLTAHASNVVQFLNYRLDLFVVAWFRGPAEVGLYALAGSTAQLVWLLSNSAASVIFPRVASGADSPRAAVERTTRVARLLLLGSALAAAALAIVGRPLFAVVFGSGFEDAYWPLLLLLPGIVVFASTNVLASYLAGMGRPQLNFYVAITGLAATLVLDMALIPVFGMSGAAVASSLSYGCGAIAMAALFGRATGRPLLDLIPRGADVRALVSMIPWLGR